MKSNLSNSNNRFESSAYRFYNGLRNRTLPMIEALRDDKSPQNQPGLLRRKNSVSLIIRKPLGKRQLRKLEKRLKHKSSNRQKGAFGNASRKTA